MKNAPSIVAIFKFIETKVVHDSRSVADASAATLGYRMMLG
jgi:hypothetical protein